MTRRFARFLATAGTVALLAGCGGAEPTPAEPAGGSGLPALPTRPVELPLNGTDPCTLLTPEQLRQWRVRPETAKKQTDVDRFGSVGCLWGTSMLPPFGSPLVTLVVAQPIDYYGYRLDRAQISDIGGFPAVRDSTASVDRPDDICIELIDIAQGQTLWIQYGTVLSSPGQINREQACAKARELGQAVIATLRAQQGK